VAALSGTVLDAGGAPLAGVRVMLARAPSATPDIALVTGADGRFLLGAPDPGLYEIAATAPDGETRTARVEVGPAGDPPPVELRFGGG
jgi:hypothetical protein